MARSGRPAGVLLLVVVLVGCGAASTGTSNGMGGAPTGSGGGGSVGGNAGTGGVSAAGGSATGGAGGATAGRGGTSGTGGATAGTGGSTPVIANAIYAAPNGSASAAGTIDNPTTLAGAVTKVSAGGTIYLRGGRYGLTSTISLSKSGSGGSPINLRSYPLDADRPVLDFTNEASGSRGLSLSGSYWHLYGIDVYNAGDNCLNVSGSICL